MPMIVFERRDPNNNRLETTQESVSRIESDLEKIRSEFGDYRDEVVNLKLQYQYQQTELVRVNAEAQKEIQNLATRYTALEQKIESFRPGARQFLGYAGFMIVLLTSLTGVAFFFVNAQIADKTSSYANFMAENKDVKDIVHRLDLRNERSTSIDQLADADRAQLNRRISALEVEVSREQAARKENVERLRSLIVEIGSHLKHLSQFIHYLWKHTFGDDLPSINTDLLSDKTGGSDSK